MCVVGQGRCKWQVGVGWGDVVTMPENIGFATRTMFLACSEAELEFHILKYFLTSYSLSTQFLAFRSI